MLHTKCNVVETNCQEVAQLNHFLFQSALTNCQEVAQLNHSFLKVIIPFSKHTHRNWFPQASQKGLLNFNNYIRADLPRRIYVCLMCSHTILGPHLHICRPVVLCGNEPPVIIHLNPNLLIKEATELFISCSGQMWQQSPLTQETREHHSSSAQRCCLEVQFEGLLQSA